LGRDHLNAALRGRADIRVAHPAESGDQQNAATALNRYGRVEEVAALVAFVAGSEAPSTAPTPSRDDSLFRRRHRSLLPQKIRQAALSCGFEF
jgi:hypothetical protein